MKTKLVIIIIFILTPFSQYAQQHISWVNLNNAEVISGTTNNLKNSGVGHWAYGASKEIIEIGCDGWFEYTVGSVGSEVQFAIKGNYMVPMPWFSSSIPYSIQQSHDISSGNTFFNLRSNGSVISSFAVSSLASGDKIRIERKNGLMHLYVAGVLRNNSVTYNGVLQLQVIITPNDQINDVQYFETACRNCSHSDWYEENTASCSPIITDNIYTEGKVGIGVQSPSESLDVLGKARVRDIPFNNTLDKVVFTDDDGVLHHRLLDNLIPVEDKDWLKVGGGLAGSENDDIYTKGLVGIRNTTPDAVLDILHPCITQPGLRIRQASFCSNVTTRGDLVQIDQIDAYGGPDIPMLNFNASGNWALGTKSDEMIKAEICNNSAGLASFVSYKAPHPSSDPFDPGNGQTAQPLWQYNSVFKVGDAGEWSDNTIAVAVNRGDCDQLNDDVFRVYGNGLVISTGGYGIFSDATLKQNIVTIENPIAKLQQLNGVTYSYKSNTSLKMDLPEGTQTGLIAGEVAEVIPDAVKTITEGTEEFKVVDYTKVIPLLVESIKMQQELYTSKLELYNKLMKKKEQLTLSMEQNSNVNH